jgi:hypothetical protein
MNSEYIQNLRYKLQKRVRRLNSTGYQLYHSTLKQFWGFLKGNELLAGVLEELENRQSAMDIEVTKLIDTNQGWACDTEDENAAFSYYVIKRCAESDDQLIFKIGLIYSDETNYREMLSDFHSIFVEPLYEYIDEQLDDQRAILSLLRRYKHKCEWFQRKHLFDLWENDTKRGEKILALHLYEYLHDQGLDFSIEPSSISGKADLVAAQNSADPLIADAKIFNPEKGKDIAYLAKGFNQVYIYTLDYNEQFGYLVIFKTCEDDLKFALSNSAQSTPFVSHNNKTIYILTIDIYPHEHSASKRGILKTREITEANLIQLIDKERTDVEIRIDTDR